MLEIRRHSITGGVSTKPPNWSVATISSAAQLDVLHSKRSLSSDIGDCWRNNNQHQRSMSLTQLSTFNQTNPPEVDYVKTMNYGWVDTHQDADTSRNNVAFGGNFLERRKRTQSELKHEDDDAMVVSPWKAPKFDDGEWQRMNEDEFMDVRPYSVGRTLQTILEMTESFCDSKVLSSVSGAVDESQRAETDCDPNVLDSERDSFKVLGRSSDNYYAPAGQSSLIVLNNMADRSSSAVAVDNLCTRQKSENAGQTFSSQRLDTGLNFDKVSASGVEEKAVQNCAGFKTSHRGIFGFNFHRKGSLREKNAKKAVGSDELNSTSNSASSSKSDLNSTTNSTASKRRQNFLKVRRSV